jgi:predicted Rossmann fold nucleotide-binding protein DprA/Smf involved in DNA uptake
LDDLIAASGQSATALLPLLTVLELKGAVKAVPGGRYISLR